VSLDLRRRFDIIAASKMAKKDTARKKLSPEQERDLDIEIGFLEGVVNRDPSYVEALQVLGDDYTRRGRFAEGLDVDQRLVRAKPDDPVTLYNLACSYSLTGQQEAAFPALEQALKSGFSDYKWLAKDPDLATFRKHPLYKKIKALIAKLQPDAE
jgi:tetratricopeptide (TPR) repeat protein